MNGIYITNWIEEETAGYCYDRKVAFIDEVLNDLNAYRIEYIMEQKTTPPNDTEPNTSQ